MTDLLARLDLPPQTRAIIVTADGLGSSNAANLGVYQALRRGLATTAGLQVPCPWSRGAAADYQGEDIGVALTLNSEHDLYRWGPVTRGASLVDGDGGFPRTVSDLWDHADLEEARRECSAQIERAVLWGFDVSHLDSHLGALWGRPEFFDLYLELAIDFSLPISLPGPQVDLGFPARELAADEGILTPDHSVLVPLPGEVRRAAEAVVADLQPGVTELHVRPAVDTPELRAISEQWSARVGDAHLVTHDIGFKAALQRSGATLIGYRDLRRAQRRQ